MNRHFKADCPDQLWVTDSTYVPMVAGFGYTAFAIDAFAGLIVGWECSRTKRTEFVEAAIRQAAAYRRRHGRPLPGNTIHHSDAGSQFKAVRFGETLALEGLTPDRQRRRRPRQRLAETTIGLYKTECIRDESPFRRGSLTTLADLEEITSAWVHWYNSQRLMHRIGRIPPAEAEAAYYAATEAADPTAAHTN